MFNPQIKQNFAKSMGYTTGNFRDGKPNPQQQPAAQTVQTVTRNMII